jgi:hypothetical protein
LSKNLHVKTPGKNVGKKISFNIVLGRKNFWYDTPKAQVTKERKKENSTLTPN